MGDDARTRAHEVLFAAFGSDGSIRHVNPYQAVDALIDAGWGPPSHLDRLAAWADEDDRRIVRIKRDPGEVWIVVADHGGHGESEACDRVQEAARRVLARLEATDG